MNKVLDNLFDQMEKIDTDNIYQEKLFNSSELLKIKQEQRKKTQEKYHIYYIQCINKIKELNRLNKTDLFFQIPLKHFGDSHYNPSDCIDLIRHHLEQNKFYTTKISETKIFITWKYLEIDLQNN